MQIKDVWSEKQLEIFKFLVIEYWVNNKSMKYIQKKYNICTQYWMKKFKIPIRSRGKCYPSFNSKWNELSYGQKHYRMRKIIPKPKICPICNEKRKLALTNLNHKYNEDPKEWMYKCYRCHRNYDLYEGLIEF